ncbi:MAG TPA: RNA polymerase sigma factor [Holophaga sp.]|nr:RNA polymerase sigma factor [Holophaga sp.]
MKVEGTDAEVMARVRAGSREGLGVLFDRHHQGLLGFFRRLTGQPHLAEDMAQEVFLRVLKYGRGFRDGAAFRPWFYQIARRVHLDHLGAAVPPGPEPDTLLSPAESPLVEAVRLQDRERLERALAALPAGRRELLLLSRDPDLSYQDLAGLYGCSEGAIKVRVHRALQELRAAFQEEP